MFCAVSDFLLLFTVGVVSGIFLTLTVIWKLYKRKYRL